LASSTPPARGGGSVEPTPRRALLLAAVFGALAGWLVVVVYNALGAVPPQVPWTAPLTVVVIAALVGVLAWTTHQQIQVARQRIEPQRAVAFLVLGKASALAGAMVAAGYLAFALMFVSRWEADAPRERVIRAGVAVVAGIGLMVAGLLLERACRVPDDPDDPDHADPDAGGRGTR
jgi:uncharacterized protein DUF3180